MKQAAMKPRYRFALLAAVALSTSSAVTAMASRSNRLSGAAAPVAERVVARTIAPPRVTPATHAAEPVARSAFDPSRAWVDLGCIGCHGDDGIYRDEINGAIGKPVEQVARWIRHAPSIKPGTDMPSFVGQLSEPESAALAGFVLDLAAHRTSGSEERTASETK